jgi:hypothetical protein
VFICLDSSIVGSNKHLLINDDQVAFDESIPRDAWHLTGEIKLRSKRCLDTVLALNERQLNVLPLERFVESTKCVFGEDVRPQWQHIMNQRDYRSFLDGLVKRTVIAAKDLDDGYYTNVWSRSRSILARLDRIKVDARNWYDALAVVQKDSLNRQPLDSFVFNKHGYAKPIAYDALRTRTGRLVVESGPAILTIERRFRNIIGSEYGPAGKIYILDFNALEPRIILNEFGNIIHSDGDLYADISNALFGGKYDRRTMKDALIPTLYNQTPRVLSERLNVSLEEASGFIRRVRDTFRVDDLVSRLHSEAVSSGKITNRYGRKIRVPDATDNSLINTYAQSTGVDVALLGFASLIEDLKKESKTVRPIAVLHDGLFIDAHNDDVALMLLQKSVIVDSYDAAFPLKLE